MVWKVLLCDDEAIIVKGLHRLIDWESLDIQVVGEATDGETALALIDRTGCDGRCAEPGGRAPVYLHQRLWRI